MSGRDTNNGFLIKQDSENISNSLTFVAKGDSANSDKWSKLTVTYTVPTVTGVLPPGGDQRADVGIRGLPWPPRRGQAERVGLPASGTGLRVTRQALAGVTAAVGLEQLGFRATETALPAGYPASWATESLL